MSYSNLSKQGSVSAIPYPTPDFNKHLISSIVAERHKNLIAENMYKLKSIIHMETETLTRMMHDREHLLCSLVDQYEGILSQNCCACTCHSTCTELNLPTQKQRLEYQSPFNEMKKLILEYGSLKLINKTNLAAEDSAFQVVQKIDSSEKSKSFAPKIEKYQKNSEPPESEDSFEVLDSAEVEECFCIERNADGILLHDPSCPLPSLDPRLFEATPISKMHRPSPDYFNKIMNYLGNPDPAKEAASFEAVKKWLESKGCIVSEDPSMQLRKQLQGFPFPEFGYVQDGVRKELAHVQQETETHDVQSPASPDPSPESCHNHSPPHYDLPEVEAAIGANQAERSLSQEVLDSFRNMLRDPRIPKDPRNKVSTETVAMVSEGISLALAARGKSKFSKEYVAIYSEGGALKPGEKSKVSEENVAMALGGGVFLPMKPTEKSKVSKENVATVSKGEVAKQVKASMERYLGGENEKWLR